GLYLTGCAAGLTAGDRAAEPAVVAGGGDGGPGESTVTLPSTSSPGTGVEVGTGGVTAPGWSVGEDGITGPGVSVGPDGIAVDPSAVGTVEDGTDSTGTAETSESSAMIGGVQDGRQCSPTDHLVLDRDGSTLSVT